MNGTYTYTHSMVRHSPNADEKIILEIGGKNKSKKQVSNIKNAYIAKDQIEIGIDNVVPVWIFGFLY